MTTSASATRGEEAAQPKDAAQLQLLTRNAFRLLGVAGSASQREIHEAAAGVRRLLKLEVSSEKPRDLLWLGRASRSETDVRDALGRLGNPSQRVAERLFWLFESFPLAQVQSADELTPVVDELVSAGTPAATHDAAVLSFAAALRFDAEMKDEAVWTRALRLWREVCDGDGFWSLLVTADLKGDFEPLATYGEVRELRARTMLLVTAPVASLARDGVARTDYATTRRALSLLRHAGLDTKLINGYENEILAPVEDRFEELCTRVFEEFRRERWRLNSKLHKIQLCNRTLRRFNEEIKPALSKFLELADADSLSTRRVFETAATSLEELARVYRENAEPGMGLRLTRKAWALVPPESEASIEIEASLRRCGGADIIKERTPAQYLDGLRKELRPPTELFAHYIEREKILAQPSTTHTNARSFSSSSSSFASTPSLGSRFASLRPFSVFIFIVAVSFMCSWCNDSGRRARSNANIYSPYNYNYNYNANVRMPRAIIPPANLPTINIEQLNLEPRTYGSRAPARRSSRGTRERETTLTPPARTATRANR